MNGKLWVHLAVPEISSPVFCAFWPAMPANMGRHACLANPAQGSVCEILGTQAIKPHKVRTYLERRDPEFEAKWHKSCAFAKRWKSWRWPAAASAEASGRQAIVSYDGKPGMQAIGATAPDLPPKPKRSCGLNRDHEDMRHGTPSLLGLDRSHDR
jgi:hypothetical protein